MRESNKIRIKSFGYKSHALYDIMDNSKNVTADKMAAGKSMACTEKRVKSQEKPLCGKVKVVRMPEEICYSTKKNANA